MDGVLQKYDISDEAWTLIEPHLPGQVGQWGGIAMDNRRFINAVFWILRTGKPWRNLPAEYGKWGTVHQRFIRWRDKGVWEILLELLLQKSGFEWLIIDDNYTHILADTTAEAHNGNKGTKRTKRGSAPRYIWPWMRMLCQSEKLSQQIQQHIISKL